jgi:hypothetical protein
MHDFLMSAIVDEETPPAIENALDRLGWQQAPPRALTDSKPAFPQTGNQPRSVRRRDFWRVGSADPLDALVWGQAAIFADAID